MLKHGAEVAFAESCAPEVLSQFLKEEPIGTPCCRAVIGGERVPEERREQTPVSSVLSTEVDALSSAERDEVRQARRLVQF
jgi:hypothetical protein